MSHPFLSVVIPTYNRCDSLAVTLKALRSQSYSLGQFEVIVVSDGCTDKTEELVERTAAQVNYRLLLVRQSNAGPAAARNLGIREACGDVVVFLDDDVEPTPAFLEAHAVHHEREERVGVIGPMVRDPARLEASWIAWEHAMLERQYRNWRLGIWPGAGPAHFYTGNASIRRAHLLAVGGFDRWYTRQEDVQLAFRMQAELDLRFAFEPRAVGIHRPLRSFDAWLKVPYAYGQFDVMRATRGELPWTQVRDAYSQRNRVTQLVAAISLRRPRSSGALRSALVSGAGVCHRAGLPSLATAVMSVVYNVRYLEGAQEMLGGWSKVHTLGEQSSDARERSPEC